MPEETPKPAAKKASKKTAKKVAKKVSRQDKRDAKHEQAKKDASKRISEVVASAPVYAKQVGGVMLVDTKVKSKDASGETKCVTERTEMSLGDFGAKYEAIPGTHKLYKAKG